MRSRPKQVNYLAKFGQQRADAAPAGDASEKDRKAIRSADLIIGSNASAKSGAILPKKPAGASRAPSGGRGAMQQQQHQHEAAAPSHVQVDNTGGKIAQYRSLDDMPDKFSSFGAKQSAYEPSVRPPAHAQAAAAGGGGGGGIAKFGQVGDDREDYWAAAAPSSAPPAVTGAGAAAKPRARNAIQSSQQQQEGGASAKAGRDADDGFEHFGRTSVDDDNHWGVPAPRLPEKRRQRLPGQGQGQATKQLRSGRDDGDEEEEDYNGDGGGDAWTQSSAYVPPPQQPQQPRLRAIQSLAEPPVVVRDVHVHYGAEARPEQQQQQQQQRRNNEYSPRLGQGQGQGQGNNGGYQPAASPRARPAQNVIPRLGNMRPMQQERDGDDSDDGNGSNGYGYGQGKERGQVRVKAADHGFSPPRSNPNANPNPHARQQPQQQQQAAGAEADGPSKRHGASPRVPAHAVASAAAQAAADDDAAAVGNIRRKGPPPLPAMLNRRLESGGGGDDDDDDWLDPPTDRSRRSDGRAGAGSGPSSSSNNNNRYISPIRDRKHDQQSHSHSRGKDDSPRMEYDDDSVDDVPARGKRGEGLQQRKHALSPKGKQNNRDNRDRDGDRDGNVQFGRQGSVASKDKDRDRDRDRDASSEAAEDARRRVGRVQAGAHVRKGAPQLVSPRVSLDSVNPDAPPLPSDAAARRARGSNQEELPEKEKLHYSKAPRKVEYKPYTLADYQQIKPKEYVEVPRLQPDLNSDVLVAKRANQQRVKDFSKLLKDYNRAEVVQHKLQVQVKEALEGGGGGGVGDYGDGEQGAAAGPASKKGPRALGAGVGAGAGAGHGSAAAAAAAASKRGRALAYGQELRSKVAASHEASAAAAAAAVAAAVDDKHSKNNRGKTKTKANASDSDNYGDDDWRGDDDMFDDAYVSAPDHTGMGAGKAREIEELENAHNDGRRQIDAIKRALKL